MRNRPQLLLGDAMMARAASNTYGLMGSKSVATGGPDACTGAAAAALTAGSGDAGFLFFFCRFDAAAAEDAALAMPATSVGALRTDESGISRRA